MNVWVAARQARDNCDAAQRSVDSARQQLANAEAQVGRMQLRLSALKKKQREALKKLDAAEKHTRENLV